MGCSCYKNTGHASSCDQGGSRQSLPVRCCVTLLKWYKLFVSPFLPPSCRFTPTCSEYAIDAVQKKGILFGMALAVYRLLRCHPFARGGYDPVD